MGFFQQCLQLILQPYFLTSQLVLGARHSSPEALFGIGYSSSTSSSATTTASFFLRTSIPAILYGIGFLLAGAESVLEITLSRVSGYRRSHTGRDNAPFIRSITHAPDQTALRP